MADETLTFALGILGGAVLVLVLVAMLRQVTQQQQSQTAQMSTYNVVRDDAGRIQTVDTVSGLPLEGQPQRQIGPAATE